jgi:hypothetical protein
VSFCSLHNPSDLHKSTSDLLVCFTYLTYLGSKVLYSRHDRVPDSRGPLDLETLTPHTTVSCNVFHHIHYSLTHSTGCDGLRHISRPTELEILANRDAIFPSGWIAHANGPIPVIFADISGFKLQIQISFSLLDRPSNSAGILDLPALTSLCILHTLLQLGLLWEIMFKEILGTGNAIQNAHLIEIRDEEGSPQQSRDLC